MSLAVKPHRFTLQVMTENVDAESVRLPPSVLTTIGPKRGLITPKSQDAAFRAVGLDLRRPHKLLTDELDATYLKVGNRIRYENRTFVIAAPIRRHDAGDAADHVSVMLEELDVV